MSRWMQVVAVALAAVVGLVPAFAQPGYGYAVPAEQPLVILPHGGELSNTELLDVDGEAGGANIVTGGILGAVSGFAYELHEQLGDLRQGRRSHLDAGELGESAWGGALVGAVLAPVAPYVHKGVVAAGHACARAGRYLVTTALAAGHRTHEALHTVHVTLHHYVREPVVNAFRDLWDWLTKRGR